MAAAAAELRRRTQPRPAGPPRTSAQPRPAAQRPADPRSASQQPVSPRPATRDPRPVSTGQVPVARTRATAAGPTGTAQLPVLRQDPPAPTRDPARRRLREEPQPVGAPQPALRPRAAEPALRHEPAASAGSPVPAPRPVIRTVPPPPAAADPEPPTARRRRPLRQAFAVLAALGLISIHALPSIAAAEAPPVAGIHQDDDLQQFQVGEVDASGARMDGVSGDMPVVAPTWVVPMKGELRDGFGPRLQQPVAGVSLFHRGQDIGGGCGAPIHVAAAGVVETTGWWGTYGNWTLVQHGDGIETGYAHQARIIVRPGQHVAANQVIGYEGSTGASTGCHLHLEVHINGVAVNPVPFFKAKGIPLGQ